MARERGTFNFSANLEVKKQGALDSRLVVQTYAELVLETTWADSDNKVWLYDGMIVSVVNDQTGKNGVYKLDNKDAYKSASSWTRIDAAGVVSTVIVDNLTSDSTTEALSANQGKVLKGEIDDHVNNSNIHITSGDKVKLEGIESNAEVNQNTFSSIKIGDITIEADSKTDTLELVAGPNVNITQDATDDKKLTISAVNTTYKTATQSEAGLLSTSDKKKLDRIADGAEVNQNAFSEIVVGTKKISADAKTDTFEIVAGNDNINISVDETNSKLTISTKDTTYENATTSSAGLMSSSDKTKLNNIESGANKYIHPSHTSAEVGLYKVSVDSEGHVSSVSSVTKSDITSLGIPGEDTHYASKNVVGSSTATSNTTTSLSNGSVYLNSVENNKVTSSHKISGSGNTTVTSDSSGNIVINSPTTIAWGSVTGAPTEFTPEDHTHEKSEITDFPDTKELNVNGVAFNVYTDDNTLPSIYAPTSLGTNGQVLKSDGSKLVWSSDKNDNTWRGVALTNGTTDTSVLGTGTNTGSLKFKAGSNINLTASSGTITIDSTDTNTTYSVSGTLDGNTHKTTLTGSDGNTSDSVVPAMTAATSSAAGKAGLVPAPAKGDQGKFLNGSGTWATPTNTTYTFTDGTNGSFSVTPSGGSAKTVSIGKPATAGAADSAAKVDNALTVTVNSGATEGTDKYTFDGSDTKSLNIVAGNNVTLTASAGSLKIDSSYTNTDEKVKVTTGTTTKSYLVGVNATNYTSGNATNKLIADTNIYLDTTAGKLTAKEFSATTLSGNLKGTIDSTTTATTAEAGDNSTKVATTSFVGTAISNALGELSNALLFKGVVSSNSDLPATHEVGWTYRVSVAGTYAGQKCEVGDMIICITAGTTATNSHWTVAQNNIDGAITGSSTSSTSGNFAVFDGTTGKIIKDSGKKASDFTYTAGTGLVLENNEFSIDSSLTAGSYGPSSDVTGNNGNTISVPQITVDENGLITEITQKTYTSKNTDTHYTTGLYVGAKDSKSNAATSNGSTYIKLYDNDTSRASFKISGSGKTTVTSDASGNITINSTDSDTTYSLSGALDGNTFVSTLTPSNGGTATTSTVPVMGAASSSVAGTAGLVPGAAAGDQGKYLKADGSWATPYSHPTYTAVDGKPDANATPGFGGTFTVTDITTNTLGHVTSGASRTITIPNSAATTSAAGLMSAADKTKLNGIASGANNYTLPTAGTEAIGGIKIAKDTSSYTVAAATSGTISANITSGKYYAVEIDADDKAFVYVPWKNTEYTAMTASEATTGTGTTARSITAKVLHDKIAGMLPGTMTGATSSAAGASGLVPAPAAGNQDKFLKADGSWASIAHTHKVTASGTVGNATASGTVSSTFSGTAHNHSFTGSEVASGGPSGTTTVYSITGVGTLPSVTMPSVSVSYSEGTLTITHNAGSYTAGTLPTRSSVTVPKSDHTHNVTAAGSIGNKTAGGTVTSTFTGTEHNHTFTGSEVSTGNASY